MRKHLWLIAFSLLLSTISCFNITATELNSKTTTSSFCYFSGIEYLIKNPYFTQNHNGVSDDSYINILSENNDKTLATFSFDGNTSGQIQLSDKYKDANISWEYSLDGGNNWIQTKEQTVQLTPAQLSSVTATNDIKIHIVGNSYNEQNIYTIDIKPSAGLPSDLYANDLENKLIGATSSMEWKYDSDNWTNYYSLDSEWTTFGAKSPDLNGNARIIVRSGATGVYLAGNENTVFKFTNNTQPDNKKYISITRLSIHNVTSAQDAFSAINAIDGNINTYWRTSNDATDIDKTIVIKINAPTYISAMEYVPNQAETKGRIRNAIIYTSMDGNNWSDAGRISNWPDNNVSKTVEFTAPMPAQYVKLVVLNSWGGNDSFVSAAMINLFEDKTKTPPATVPETTTKDENNILPETTKKEECNTSPETTTKLNSNIPSETTTKLNSNTPSETTTKKITITTDETITTKSNIENSTLSSNTGNKPNKVTAPGRVKITGISVKKKKATLKWKKVSKAKGYKIQYSTSKKFVSKKTKTKYTSKLNITIKKLKSKKTYYFRIKAYKNAGNNSKVYSKKWSAVKYKKIKQQSLVM